MAPKRYDDREGPMTWDSFREARREMIRFISILFVVVVLFVTWTLWQNEHDSCLRSRATRTTQRASLGQLHARGLVTRDVKAPSALSCTKLLPDH